MKAQPSPQSAKTLNPRLLFDLEHADLLLLLENDKDVEGCVQAIMSIRSFFNSFDATIIVRSITDSITS
jgi:hypothetical protein